MHDCKLTRHAEDRIRDMGVTVDQVVDVLRNHSSRYRGSHGNGWVLRGRPEHDVSIVVDNTFHIVITVLWNTTDQYERPA